LYFQGGWRDFVKRIQGRTGLSISGVEGSSQSKRKKNGGWKYCEKGDGFKRERDFTKSAAVVLTEGKATGLGAASPE